jgi:macrolide-specific efflux system membrane fusion protein
VESVDPGAKIRDNVVNYVTVVRFRRPKDLVLRPEMTATVRIALEARENVLTVLRRACGARAGGPSSGWLRANAAS